jgi:DNA/RNA-binding domain of Phe-tRNA-synthetase-like protein
VRAATKVAALIELGLLTASGLRVRPADASLAEALAAAASAARARTPEGALGTVPAVKAVRALFSALGVDPTRTRPSSEALLRRAVQGKGLPHVNNVVDAVNLCSLEAQLPVGLYDRAAIRGEIWLDLGGDGAGYAGLGKERVGLAGRPALFDDDGPFGAPTSDSFRTRVHEGTTEILCIVFAPRSMGSDPSAVGVCLTGIRSALVTYCAASPERIHAHVPALHSA